MELLMKFRFLQIVCLFLMAITLFTSGCASGKKRNNTETAPVIDEKLYAILRQNLTATGGAPLWQGAAQLNVNSISTLITDDYGKMLTRQLISVDTKVPAEVSILSALSQGDLIETLSPSGHYCSSGLKHVETHQQIKNAKQRLSLISQAITQSSRLFGDKVQLRYICEELRGGRKNHKVEVISLMDDIQNPGVLIKSSDVMVLWIGADTYFVNKIWLKFKVTGGEGYEYLGCNLRNYKEQVGGFVLPNYIGIVTSDKHQQFSEHESYRIEAQKYGVVMGEIVAEQVNIATAVEPKKKSNSFLSKLWKTLNIN